MARCTAADENQTRNAGVELREPRRPPGSRSPARFNSMQKSGVGRLVSRFHVNQSVLDAA